MQHQTNMALKTKWSPTTAILLLVLSLVRAQGFADKENEENRDIEKRYDCRCVRYNQCRDNIIVTTGELVTGRRIGSTIIPCKGGTVPNEFICCKQRDSKKASLLQPNARSVEAEKCGTQIDVVSPRIQTDKDDSQVYPGEFTWTIAIFTKTTDGDYEFRCSGSLIHPEVVLTANHCVRRGKPGDFVVEANQKNKPTRDEEKRRGVSEIVNHPNFVRSPRLFNDAALLILEKPYEIGKDLRTLCLPSNDVNVEGIKCYVAGWGTGSQGQESDVLRRVEVPIVDNNSCQDLLRKTDLGDGFKLHKSFMCAGGEEGNDACIGDGGAALMCPIPLEDNRYFQAGIVPWGVGCGQKDVPGVYTNILQISDWIRDEIQSRSLMY